MRGAELDLPKVMQAPQERGQTRGNRAKSRAIARQKFGACARTG